jgi:hypothetical protein
VRLDGLDRGQQRLRELAGAARRTVLIDLDREAGGFTGALYAGRE